MTVVCLQICPAPPQVHMGRSSTSSDLKSISKPHLYSLLTSFKSFSTRTPIYLSVSPHLPIYMSSDLCFDLSLSILTIFSVVSWQCDPALLPEPNHVMLNHLYALSIKVGSLEGLLTLFKILVAPHLILIEDSRIWVFPPQLY